MLKQTKSYLNFYFKSKSLHGTHSPFVFNLIKDCFYDTTNYPEYEILKNYRTALLNNHQEIEVNDFGAGSRVFTSNKRKVSAIAKNAGITPKRAELLFRMVQYFHPNEILEIGTSLGLATSALSLGNPEGKIITLEGCPSTLEVCKVQSSKFKVQNVEFINTNFSDYFNNFQLPTSSFQLIYFDGNHTKKATLDYFELLLPTVQNDTIWIFDDIHWSTEMEEAWDIIKSHSKVTATIDTWQWGIVFFRKEQQKEHFVIQPEKPLSSKILEFLRIKM